MAWLIRSPNGWIVRWNVRRDGKLRRRQVATGTRDKRKALKIKVAIEDELRNRKFGILDPSPLPFSKLIEHRIRYLEDQNRSPNSIEHEKYTLKGFASFLERDLSLSDITMDDFEAYKRWRRGAGVAPGAVNSDLKHLQATINWAAGHGYCQRVNIPKLKVEKQLPPFLEEDEIERFFRAIDTLKPPIPKHADVKDEDRWRDYWRTVFELYLNTGGRKQEVANLRWRDVDFNRGVVIFRSAYTKNAADREIPLNSDLIEKLHKMKGLLQDRILHQSGGQIYRMYQRYMLAAGITDKVKLQLHTLRHTFASHLIMQGANLAAVSKLLGHSSIRVTMDTYIHLTPDYMGDTVQLLPWVQKRVMGK